MPRSQRGIEQRFLWGQQVVCYRRQTPMPRKICEKYENHGNPYISMKIYKIRWKSSDGKDKGSNRAKVFIGATGCLLPAANIHAQNPWTSMKIEEIHEYLWKSIKIWKIRWSPEWCQETSLESSKYFYKDSRLSLTRGKHPCPKFCKSKKQL